MRNTFVEYIYIYCVLHYCELMRLNIVHCQTGEQNENIQTQYVYLEVEQLRV